MLGLKKRAIGERGREDKRKKKENGGRRQISQQRRARPFPSHIRKRDGRRDGGEAPLFFLAEGSLRLPPPPGLPGSAGLLGWCDLWLLLVTAGCV